MPHVVRGTPAGIKTAIAVWSRACRWARNPKDFYRAQANLIGWSSRTGEPSGQTAQRDGGWRTDIRTASDRFGAARLVPARSGVAVSASGGEGGDTRFR